MPGNVNSRKLDYGIRGIPKLFLTFLRRPPLIKWRLIENTYTSLDETCMCLFVQMHDTHKTSLRLRVKDVVFIGDNQVIDSSPNDRTYRLNSSSSRYLSACHIPLFVSLESSESWNFNHITISPSSLMNYCCYFIQFRDIHAVLVKSSTRHRQRSNFLWK